MANFQGGRTLAAFTRELAVVNVGSDCPVLGRFRRRRSSRLAQAHNILRASARLGASRRPAPIPSARIAPRPCGRRHPGPPIVVAACNLCSCRRSLSSKFRRVAGRAPSDATIRLAYRRYLVPSKPMVPLRLGVKAMRWMDKEPRRRPSLAFLAGKYRIGVSNADSSLAGGPPHQ